jgi:hypothetical protein
VSHLGLHVGRKLHYRSRLTPGIEAIANAVGWLGLGLGQAGRQALLPLHFVLHSRRLFVPCIHVPGDSKLYVTVRCVVIVEGSKP